MSVAGRARRKDISNRQWDSVSRVRRALVDTTNLAFLPRISTHNSVLHYPKMWPLGVIDLLFVVDYWATPRVNRGARSYDRLPKEGLMRVVFA